MESRCLPIVLGREEGLADDYRFLWTADRRQVTLSVTRDPPAQSRMRDKTGLQNAYILLNNNYNNVPFEVVVTSK